MGMGFAPTWLHQVSPTASENHFNDCLQDHQYVCHCAARFDASLPAFTLYQIILLADIRNTVQEITGMRFVRNGTQDSTAYVCEYNAPTICILQEKKQNMHTICYYTLVIVNN